MKIGLGTLGFISVLGLTLNFLHGCQKYNEKSERIKLPMEAKSGSKVEGHAKLYQKDGHVLIKLNVKGLKKNTLHGFHIHEKGDCSAKDASSAGGHYNPLGVDHGHPLERKNHFGDLGNIPADEKGEADINLIVHDANLYDKEDKMSILNKALVIHAGTDDLISQPSGAAGARVACGVISKS